MGPRLTILSVIKHACDYIQPQQNVITLKCEYHQGVLCHKLSMVVDVTTFILTFKRQSCIYTGRELGHHYACRFPCTLGVRPSAGTVLTRKLDVFVSKIPWLSIAFVKNFLPDGVIHNGHQCDLTASRGLEVSLHCWMSHWCLGLYSLTLRRLTAKSREVSKPRDWVL